MRWWLVAVVIAFFALIYVPTMRRERDRIQRAFPEEYAEFERHVPPFFPRLVPWRRNGVRGRFSAALYMRHGEWKVVLGYAAAVTWLVVRAYSMV